MADGPAEYKVCLDSDATPFTAHGNESLLQAGQRAGLNLRYGCANGSCGECQATLTSGELKPFRHSDYVFNAAERAARHFLMCSCAAASDLSIEAVFYNGPEDLPKQSMRARIAHVRPAGPSVQVITLRLPRTQPLRFLAGQAISLSIPGLAPRCFAIASCPCQGRQLQLHLPVDPQDPWQSEAARKLLRGQTVDIYGPVGRFTLDESDTGRPLVFVAWDEGFAPVQSLIDHAISLEWTGDMHLLWVADPERGHYLKNTARAWVDSLDNFRAEYVYGLDERDLAPLPEDADWYLAGPREQVRALRQRLPVMPKGYATDEDVCAADRDTPR